MERAYGRLKYIEKYKSLAAVGTYRLKEY